MPHVTSLLALDPDCRGAQTARQVLASYRTRGFDARRLVLVETSLAAGHAALCPRCRLFGRALARKGETEMVALPDLTEPTSSTDLQQIPALCRRLLALTVEPAVARLWLRERKGARDILNAARKPGYFTTSDSCWDHDWLVSTISDVVEALESPAARQPEEGPRPGRFYGVTGPRGK